MVFENNFYTIVSYGPKNYNMSHNRSFSINFGMLNSNLLLKFKLLEGFLRYGNSKSKKQSCHISKTFPAIYTFFKKFVFSVPKLMKNDE